VHTYRKAAVYIYPKSCVTHHEVTQLKQAGDASRRASYLAGAAGLLLTVAVVSYPEESFKASLDGLRLWFDVVLPALLPFFAMSEILLGLGVIHAAGVLLEPLMRPLFRIPGTGGFVVAMGLASGYPLGAKLTGALRRQNLCNREEAERLISFANTADPLFMVGAVAVGMFGLPQLGVTIAAAHYLAVIVVGFLMRYHAGGRMSPPAPRGRGAILARALDAMAEARRKDARPFGELFRDAVKETVNAMLFIGGCIMMFSVFLRVMTVAGVAGLAAAPVALVLGWLGFDPELAAALVKGAVEITIGSQAAALADADLLAKAVAASAIIAWSGLSVHAQVAAMVHGTDIRIAPYLAARLLHAVTAGIFTVLLFEPLGAGDAVRAMSPAAPAQVPVLGLLGASGALFAGVLAVLVAGALVLRVFGRIKIAYFKV